MEIVDAVTDAVTQSPEFISLRDDLITLIVATLATLLTAVVARVGGKLGHKFDEEARTQLEARFARVLDRAVTAATLHVTPMTSYGKATARAVVVDYIEETSPDLMRAMRIDRSDLEARAFSARIDTEIDRRVQASAKVPRG